MSRYSTIRRQAAIAAMACAALCAALPTQAQVAVQLDRIAALVNGQPILESDVQLEMRIAELVPGSGSATAASPEAMRDEAMNRLIDRALITAQEQWQPPPPVTDAELAADIAELQRRIPDCAEKKCATHAGWVAVLKAHGITEQEFNTRWRARIEMLRFIELRFRDGVRINREEIDIYYRNVLTPEYAATNAAPPPLDAVQTRIQQLLVEQRISTLLEDWLKQLRGGGNVRILTPGEDLP